MIHKDDRRTLESFPEGKMITANSDCIVGQHYHKIKTEIFFLRHGECRYIYYDIHSKNVIHDASMYAGEIITIRPNTYHEFHLKEGALLIGLCSHTYDPSDDYR